MISKRDVNNILYIARGLTRDMTTEAPFAVGYRMGVRQMENAIQMLAKGQGYSMNSIVHLARKNVKAKKAFAPLLPYDEARIRTAQLQPHELKSTENETRGIAGTESD